MQTPRVRFGAVWLPDGRLFAIGGNAGQVDSTDKVEMLVCSNQDNNAATQVDWKPVRPLVKARESHSAAYIGGKVVVVGGANECTVECFTLPTEQEPMGQWTLLYPLPQPLEMKALVPVENVLIGVCRLLLFTITRLFRTFTD